MPRETVIHDATIVTGDDVDSVLYDAALVVEDDRIAAIGPTRELAARYPVAERVDGRGRAVMPRFANLHTHFVLTLARGIFEDLSPHQQPAVYRRAGPPCRCPSSPLPRPR